MGVMHFSAPSGLSQEMVERAYLVGLDGVPWPCRSTRTPQGVAIERAVSDSGMFHIAWPVEGHGEPVLSTGILMERERPYLLPLELARGTLLRIRNQWALWEAAGLVAPAAIVEKHRAVAKEFTKAATQQDRPDDSAQSANRSLKLALELIDELAAEYARQAIATRRKHAPKMVTLLAGLLECRSLTDALGKQFAHVFNTAAIPLCWRTCEPESQAFHWTTADQQLQWAKSHGLKVAMGPLLQLDRRHTPDWLYVWSDDSEILEGYVADYCRAAVERYRGKVQLWQVAARMNSPDALGLTEEQRLRLVVRAVAAVHDAEPKAPLIVSFDRPWGEYCAHDRLDLSPLHFADALVRADLGLAGLGLEINLGYWPGGTLPRDLLEISRQIDRWTQFGLPLLIVLTIPSSGAADPQATPGAHALYGGTPGGLTPQGQRAIVERLMPVLLAKTAVQGIVWNQLDDGMAHEFPHGGLIEATGRTKPTWDLLAQLRREYLS